MKVAISVGVLLLALVVGDDGDRLSARPLPTTAELRAIIIAHYQAVEENRHDVAMNYYHAQAPGLADIGADLKFAMSNYLQTAGSLTFSNVGLDDGYAVIQATHRFHIISGIKFIDNTVDATYRFKEEKGVWKIWSKHDS